MARIKNSPEESSLFGRWARWTAAPYCEFKDDRARLLALVARDVQPVGSLDRRFKFLRRRAQRVENEIRARPIALFVVVGAVGLIR